MFFLPYPVSATHDYSLGINITSSWWSDGEYKYAWTVSAIQQSGMGAKSGLKVGDHILSYGGYKFTVPDVQQFKKVFEQSKTHHLIEIVISRLGQEMTLTVDNRTNQEISGDKIREKESEESVISSGFDHDSFGLRWSYRYGSFMSRCRAPKIPGSLPAKIKDKLKLIQPNDVLVEYAGFNFDFTDSNTKDSRIEKFNQNFTYISDEQHDIDGCLEIFKTGGLPKKFDIVVSRDRKLITITIDGRTEDDIVREKNQERFVSLKVQVEKFQVKSKRKAYDVLSQITDDYSNIDELIVKIDALETMNRSEIRFNQLLQRVQRFDGKHEVQGRGITDKILSDFSNVETLSAEIDKVNEDYLIYTKKKNIFEELTIDVKAFEEETKMMGMEVLSGVVDDYSNLDEIAEEIDALRKRNEFEKEYISLKNEVSNLQGNFKKQGARLLSEIMDDLSNLDKIRPHILELVDQYNRDIDNKNRFETLKQQVANLEEDFKSEAEKILNEINDDFSNFDLIDRQVAIIKSKNAKRKEEQKESLNNLGRAMAFYMIVIKCDELDLFYGDERKQAKAGMKTINDYLIKTNRISEKQSDEKWEEVAAYDEVKTMLMVLEASPDQEQCKGIADLVRLNVMEYCALAKEESVKLETCVEKEIKKDF